MIKYSIVLATNRPSGSLDYLLKTPNQETELIVIDKDYNETTKKHLEQFKAAFGKVVYAPTHRVYGFARDFAQAKNTGVMYAEGEYVVNVDDHVELCESFWRIADNDIKDYPGQIVIGQKSQEKDGEEAWRDYLAERRGVKRFDSISYPLFVSAAFAIIPIDSLLAVNGWSEIFDVGWGPEDFHLIARLGYKAKGVIDTQLMGYVHTHKSYDKNPILFAYWIYDVDIVEVQNGKFWAYNPYNLGAERERYLKEEKEKYTI